jgi:hypothetical protein
VFGVPLTQLSRSLSCSAHSAEPIRSRRPEPIAIAVAVAIALLVFSAPISLAVAELFGSQKEGSGMDAHALRERDQQFEVRVQLAVFQGRDKRRSHARSGSQIVDAETVLLAYLADRAAEDD